MSEDKHSPQTPLAPGFSFHNEGEVPRDVIVWRLGVLEEAVRTLSQEVRNALQIKEQVNLNALKLEYLEKSRDRMLYCLWGLILTCLGIVGTLVVGVVT